MSVGGMPKVKVLALKTAMPLPWTEYDVALKTQAST